MDLDSQLTFLIVDDDEFRTDIYTALLQKMGFLNYLQADDGAEAWTLLKNFQIDFVICNYEVPEVNGLVLLKLVRSHEDFATIPYVLVVSQITPKLIAHAGRAGVSEIIIQPFSSDIFKKKIEDIISMEQETQNLAADRNYKQGLELMKAGKHDEAFKTFESILTVHEHPEVYYNMGYIKSAKGQFEDALYYFRQATRIDTNFARAYKKMAEIYHKLGKSDEAGKYFQKAADIYMDRNEDNSAEEILETVMKLWPDTTNVYNSLGIIYRRQGRLDEAEEQYRKALLVHPLDENIHFNLSRIYMAKNDFKSANEALQKAIEINPDFSQARELMKAVEIRVRL